jgi:hypothetical protein
MKIVAIIAVVVACGTLQSAFAAQINERIKKAPDHPRLFAEMRNIDDLRAKIAADPLLRKSLDHITTACDTIVTLAPVERKKKGRRLLMVSRKCLKRVMYLSVAYRLTERPQYLAHAQKEMLAAAAFRNWNPDHFLDVAEMTAALAVGYDFLHDDLAPQARKTIRNAIIKKGLRPYLAGGWWVKVTNNWNQVCHGGATMGALAVLEDEPELAERVIQRALDCVPLAMASYAPDGAYPEGGGYWEYGTSYNVLLLAALESALGTDFGLADAEGFMASSDYFLHVAGPSGNFFNYSDSGLNEGVTPAIYWFADRRDKPSLLWRERPNLRRFLSTEQDFVRHKNRFFPLLLLWAQGVRQIPEPDQLHWRGDGHTPVGLHRTAWGDPQAVFVGIKGGHPSINHGHMDIGTFVMEADGVRWALDLGKQSYTGLEQHGIKLWDRSQNGERWDVFRLNNFSHNTLVVDGKKQRVDGHAPIVSFADSGERPHTIVDMSKTYAGQLAQARRGVALLGRRVLVQDEIKGLDEPAEVRWGMVTSADVQRRDARTVVLRQDGQTLLLQVLSPADVELTTFETADPPNDYDEPNPGTRMVGFKTTLPAGAHQTLAVLLAPGADQQVENMRLKALGEW